MRLVVGLVGMILSASVARAEEPKDANATEQKPEPARTRVPLRVVKLLPESHQALLFDRNRGTHVLADVGATIEGYLVEEIDEDEVTLSANGAQIVLAAPDQSWRHRRVVEKPTPAPVDPYGEPDDPYAEPEIRSAVAPRMEAGDDGVRTVAAPAPPAPATTAGSGTTPTTPPPAAPALAPATDAPALLGRQDVTLALSDFARLTTSVRGSFTPAGAKLEAISEGSLFAKVGLRVGDLVTAVDGKPLRSLDDAADLYARAGAVRVMSLQVLRGGKATVLRVTIQ